MKSITIWELKRAIKKLDTSSKNREAMEELCKAESYLLGEIKEKPKDPREVLTQLGYKFWKKVKLH